MQNNIHQCLVRVAIEDTTLPFSEGNFLAFLSFEEGKVMKKDLPISLFQWIDRTYAKLIATS